ATELLPSGEQLPTFPV
ncbi:hypothetical protein A2U01_0047174, partial [Trifolium medium]|nr:hypothetical protein [Trifolium medium]